VFSIGRNRCSPSTGIGVQDGPEYAVADLSLEASIEHWDLGQEESQVENKQTPKGNRPNEV